MLHHQEINALKVSGSNLQRKEQNGGWIFFKDFISSDIFDSKDNFHVDAWSFHFQVSYKKN